MKLSDNALEVLKRRYLAKDNKGRVIESPQEMFIRVSNFIAEADLLYGATEEQVKKTTEQFYKMMATFEFLPNSPTLMNAGRPLGQLSACFVLPVGDSMEEIFEANKNAALIHKSGGGTGFSFSRLRPKNSIVASTSGVASGPVSFMKVFNASTEAVKQGGTRRGANMGVLRVDHPDILEFITCKDDISELTNFNISVAITDAFMEALINKQKYPLYNPHTQKIHQIDGKDVYLDAQEVFDLIVDRSWRTGEPGIIFLDRMNQLNPMRPSETIEATNPCGEQPLPPYDSCNLGSINLGKFVKEPLPDNYNISEPDLGIDWEKLRNTIRTSVHFLDNVIDKNKYPLEKIERQTKRNRRIGLGVMGWADMLIKLGLPYNHEKALELADKVMSFIENEGHNQSSELVKTRGKFPNWEGSIYKQNNIAMRNATVTTIAPTGTISIIAGCSSGIEPYYSIAFERNVMDGTKLIEINPLFKTMAQQDGFYSDDLVNQLMSHRSLSDIEGIPERIKALFLTSVDISPDDHIKMQATFQKYCDSSVSKTINFPTSATREDIRRAYVLAYQSGCKGVTIYRDNSRPHQVLSTVKKKNEDIPFSSIVEKRPHVLSGFTEKIKTGYGNLYVTVNVKNNRPFEVFAHIGKSGYTTMADTEAICRLISLALRSNIPVEQVTKQLRGIGGSNQIYADGSKIFSIPDAIAQVLDKNFSHLSNKKTTSSSESGEKGVSLEICPQCSAPMRFESGCFNCVSCGYSTC
ncbi:MAG: vitamin B12-dependent ribonucleotide reductase [FCB group bacterium]|nr:vitamin B12-dependent ribonucleotide reductase [FCB group bacterium]